MPVMPASVRHRLDEDGLSLGQCHLARRLRNVWRDLRPRCAGAARHLCGIMHGKQIVAINPALAVLRNAPPTALWRASLMVLIP